MEISIQIANIGPGDLGTLSKVFGILQGSGIEVKTTTGPARRAEAAPVAAPAAKEPAPKKTRAARGSKKAAAPAAAAPSGSAEDNYSRYTRNNPNLYSASDRKTWDPILDAALAAYMAAAGGNAQGGRTIKNWSINRLRAETEALGGAPTAEGSPVPGKRARGRPPGSGKKGAGKGKRKKK